MEESSSTVATDGKARESFNNAESAPRDDADPMLIENEETMREDDTAKIQEAAAVSKKKGNAISVGGKIDKPAYCLLDGIQEFEEETKYKPPIRKTLPIRRLPAVLGRAHLADPETNFVDMGRSKALSRQHVRIEYRVATGSGSCGQLQSRAANSTAKDDFYFNTEESVKETQILKDGQLPSAGFYTITCLGKNRIIVNGKRVEHGETAHIKSGDAIRIAAFALYFFTPTEGYKKTMQVPDDGVPSSSTNPKKRRFSLAEKVSSAIPSAAGSVLAAGTSAMAKRNKSLQTEIENMRTQQLLDSMSTAIENKIWDRRHQLIGSTISQRAVVAAARDLLNRSDSSNELSRGDIMDWVADSDRFGEWVEQMLTKMEAKSYQASITKALVKVGFKRTASTGRYIKWIAPDLGEESEKDDSDSDVSDDEKSEKGDDADVKEGEAGSRLQQSADEDASEQPKKTENTDDEENVEDHDGAKNKAVKLSEDPTGGDSMEENATN